MVLTRPSVLRSRLPQNATQNDPYHHRPDSPLYNPTRNRNAAAAARAVPQGATDGYDPKAKGVASKAGGYAALPSDDPALNGGSAGGGGDDFLALDMGGGRSDQFMQMQLQENGEVSESGRATP